MELTEYMETRDILDNLYIRMFDISYKLSDYTEINQITEQIIFETNKCKTILNNIIKLLTLDIYETIKRVLPFYTKFNGTIFEWNSYLQDTITVLESHTDNSNKYYNTFRRIIGIESTNEKYIRKLIVCLKSNFIPDLNATYDIIALLQNTPTS